MHKIRENLKLEIESLHLFFLNVYLKKYSDFLLYFNFSKHKKTGMTLFILCIELQRNYLTRLFTSIWCLTILKHIQDIVKWLITKLNEFMWNGCSAVTGLWISNVPKWLEFYFPCSSSPQNDNGKNVSIITPQWFDLHCI